MTLYPPREEDPMAAVLTSGIPAGLIDFLEGQTWSDFAQSLVSQFHAKGGLSDKQIAAAMKMRATMAAKAEAKKVKAEESPAVEPITEAGMYKLGEDIFKVQKAVNGSGHLYAKKLIPGPEFGDKAQFFYAPGIVKKLTVEHKMSLSEAKAFGALYGSCCRCGRTLTDEGSIDAGIGPICATKGGWA